MNVSRLTSECVNAAGSGQLPSMSVVWFIVRGIASHAMTGKSLVKCLGARGAHRNYRKAVRNSALLNGIEKITTPGDFARAALFLEKLAAFKAGTDEWKRAFLTLPPPNYSELERCMYFALNSREPIPKRPENLCTLLFKIRRELEEKYRAVGKLK